MTAVYLLIAALLGGVIGYKLGEAVIVQQDELTGDKYLEIDGKRVPLDDPPSNAQIVKRKDSTMWD